MFSASFMFSQLFSGAVASSAALQSPLFLPAGKADESSIVADLALDETIWDAVTEAAVALTVFAVTSLFLKAYRGKKTKTPEKKVSSMRPAGMSSSRQQSATWQKTQQRASDSAGVQQAEVSDIVQAPLDARRSAIGKVAAEAPWKRASPGLARVGACAQPSETDAVASAVKAGKASQLPEILDAALVRSIAVSAHETPSACQGVVATQLLLAALRSCASSRLFREAIAVYDHMASRIGEGNAHLWSVLLYNIVEAEAFSRGESIFERLSSQTCPSGHDFVNILRCFAGLQDPSGLQAVLAKLTSLGHSVDEYALNRALAACGTSECALDLADVLVASRICAAGLDAVGYNTLMKCNARAGRLSRCFELREEMLTNGLEASEVTFGILLDACVGAQELDRARKVFEDICNSGLHLNVVICTTFIKGLAAAGRLDEAAGVLRDMKNSASVRPDLIAYSTIVKAYADAGNVSSALKMLEEMMGEGVKPDEIIFNGVLNGCCAFPLKPSVVMMTFDTLIGHGLRPSTTTLSILLKALMHADAWSTALQMLTDAPQRFGMKLEMRLYAQLAQACVKARLGNAVVDVFEAMLKTADRQGTSVDSATLGRIVRSCVLSGGPRLASELREVALRAGLALDASTEKMLTTAAKRGRERRVGQSGAA